MDFKDLFKRGMGNEENFKPLSSSQEQQELTLDQLLLNQQRARQAKDINSIVVGGVAWDAVSFKESKGINEEGDEVKEKHLSFTCDGIPITKKNISQIARCPSCTRIISQGKILECQFEEQPHTCCYYCTKIKEGKRFCNEHSRNGTDFLKWLFGNK